MLPTTLIFILLGMLGLLRPDLMVKLQIWQTKVILKAKFIPSKKTYFIYRVIFGMPFLFIGIAMFFASIS